MKSRTVDGHITSNDGIVRMRIFDGVAPPDAYHSEMAELERSQHQQARHEFLRVRASLEAHIAELADALHKLRDIEDELREQASGSQDGYLLDVANRMRAALTVARLDVQRDAHIHGVGHMKVTVDGVEHVPLTAVTVDTEQD